MSRIRFNGRVVALPASPIIRISVGVLLIIGGLLGFLPILGFWMIPLGLVVLSVDIAPVRRWRRRAQVWWEKRKREKSTAGDAEE